MRVAGRRLPEESVVFLINVVQLVVNILTVVVLIDVVLSYFLNPFHPLRQTLDQIVEPMLAPIRRIVPTMGMLDFSPFVLLILIQVLGQVVVNLLASIG